MRAHKATEADCDALDENLILVIALVIDPDASTAPVPAPAPRWSYEARLGGGAAGERPSGRRARAGRVVRRETSVWFGWNAYTGEPSRRCPRSSTTGTTSSPRRRRPTSRLIWHFGELGYINAPSPAEGSSDFKSLAALLDANRWPNLRLLLYFDAVPFQDPKVGGFAAAFASYATSSTMVRY